MSETNPTQIALFSPAVSGPSPGKATLFMQIANPDGTAPLLALDPSNATSTVVTLVQPVTNDGSNTAFPVASYPYMGVILSGTDGTVLVDLVADGIVDQVFQVTVTPASAEIASVPPQAIVVSPPGS